MSDSDSPLHSNSSSDLVTVGRILGAHGRDGGLRVKATSDVPGRFDEGNPLIFSRDGETAEGRTYEIAESRTTRNGELIIWFLGFEFRDQVERFKGLWLCVPLSDVPPAEEGEYFHYQLIGLKVRTVDGEDLGEISEILETGSNDVYVVTGPNGEILVPAIGKVVREIDVAGGIMVVDLPEGLR